MVGIKDFGMPSCCMNCEMFDGEYGNCDIIGDTQDFEYQWNENRPFDCPLVEAIPKADYENRLKADLKAMLEDLDLKIDEMYEPQFSKEGMDGFYWAQGLFKDLVQEQINALKEKDNDKL